MKQNRSTVSSLRSADSFQCFRTFSNWIFNCSYLWPADDRPPAAPSSSAVPSQPGSTDRTTALPAGLFACDILLKPPLHIQITM